MTLEFKQRYIEPLESQWITFRFEDETWFVYPDGQVADSCFWNLADITYESLYDFINSNL